MLCNQYTFFLNIVLSYLVHPPHIFVLESGEQYYEKKYSIKSSKVTRY